jgi:CubicO group peptidase (beta-lactamase class C family)
MKPRIATLLLALSPSLLPLSGTPSSDSGSPPSAPPDSGSPPPLPPPVADKLVTEALRAWDVPGAAVAVVRGEDDLLLKGFGVRRRGEPAPVTADTVFPLASCTKAFTTTLLAMLVDDGTLTWDDPVRKWLPEFRLSDPHAAALLTVRDLLCHRCGLAGHDLLWYRAPWGIDEVLRRATALPLQYPFRGGYRYSSVPFLAAGRVIEKAARQPWDKLVRRRLCEPLGMTATTLTTTALAAAADRASGHRLTKGGSVEVMPPYELPEANPAGSVNSTARDLAAWLKFHLSEGIAPDGRRLVSVANLAETKTPHNVVRLEGPVKAQCPDTVQVSYGLGWLIYDHRGKKVISHGGMIDGFRVQITLLPGENLGIAVLANLHDTRMNAALTNALIDLYCGLPARDWNAYYRKVTADEAAARQAAVAARDKARDPLRPPSIPLSDFAGTYTHPAYGLATVTPRDGHLELAWSSFRCRLEHYSGDTFRVVDGFFDDQLVPFTVVQSKATAVQFAGQRFERK